MATHVFSATGRVPAHDRCADDSTTSTTDTACDAMLIAPAVATTRKAQPQAESKLMTVVLMKALYVS